MTNLASLQGEWQAVFVKDDGRKRSADEIKSTRVTISGGRYRLCQGGLDCPGVITHIDPSEMVGAIDFVSAGGPDGGESYRGLYLLEGEELTVCVAPPGQPRPQELDSRPGSGCCLYLLRRVLQQPRPLSLNGRSGMVSAVPPHQGSGLAVGRLP